MELELTESKSVRSLVEQWQELIQNSADPPFEQPPADIVEPITQYFRSHFTDAQE